MACRSKFDPERHDRGLDRVARSMCRSSGVTLWLILVLSLVVGCASPGPSRGKLAGRYESQDVVGRIQFHKISGDETLLDLTRRYDLGYVELVAANPGVDPWVPGVGTRIVLPTAHVLPPGLREGIVINLAEQRLYLFEDETGTPLFSFPIGVSRSGWATPIGETQVVKKTESPTWYPTKSARREDPTLPTIVRAGPENPLGSHALYLGWPRYLIHGTNEPDGVGRQVSRGCIRLYPEDIVRLFESTALKARVRVIHEPVKLAWVGSDVFLEVHPTLEDMARLEVKGSLEKIRPADLRLRIREFAGAEGDRVDWKLAYRVAAERRGVPIRITP
jgi:L,D-transpeptidase ErfK/SrfK